jgi:hypothetical protein
MHIYAVAGCMHTLHSGAGGDNQAQQQINLPLMPQFRYGCVSCTQRHCPSAASHRPAGSLAQSCKTRCRETPRPSTKYKDLARCTAAVLSLHPCHTDRSRMHALCKHSDMRQALAATHKHMHATASTTPSTAQHSTAQRSWMAAYRMSARLAAAHSHSHTALAAPAARCVA